MSNIDPEKIKEAEMLLGRPLSPLELALWELYPELSTDRLRLGIDLRALVTGLEVALGRTLTSEEVALALKMLKLKRSFQQILDAIKKPRPKHAQSLTYP